MCDNPLCFDEPGLRFYAGAVLEIEEGLPIGTLCVLDYMPRDLTERQRKNLTVLADQVVTQISLRQQLQQSRQLAQEIDHRVRNSLGLVQSLLSLQARHMQEDHTRKALEIARDRVAAVAHVHDLLHRTASIDHVDLEIFVTQLIAALRGHTGDRIVLTTDLPACQIRASDAANIGVMINELVTNALRHAFPNDGSGVISVNGEMAGKVLRVSVADNGAGLPAGFQPQSSQGLGMRLATALAKQFGNDLTWTSSPDGAEFAFTLKLPDRLNGLR
jgi:two-component sensor histidine kinase